MSYIGRKPTVGNFQICDAISVVNGQAAYTMQVGSVNVLPETANHMIVSLNGVIQKPNSSFTVSGSTITFSSNLATGDVIDFIQILGDVLDLGVPSDGTVTTAKLADGAVTSAKLGTGDMTFSNGNLVFGTASKGVYLGVTSATAANLLDDYEKGTYTAGVFDANSGGNQSATTATGYYTKIGRLVNFNVAFNDINTTGLTGSNRIFVSLPFASINGQIDAQTAPFVKNFSFGGYLIFGESSGSQKSRFGFVNINNASNFTSVTVSNVTDDDNYCSISLTYITDD